MVMQIITVTRIHFSFMNINEATNEASAYIAARSKTVFNLFHRAQPEVAGSVRCDKPSIIVLPLYGT